MALYTIDDIDQSQDALISADIDFTNLIKYWPYFKD